MRAGASKQTPKGKRGAQHQRHIQLSNIDVSLEKSSFNNHTVRFDSNEPTHIALPGEGVSGKGGFVPKRVVYFGSLFDKETK